MDLKFLPAALAIRKGSPGLLEAALRLAPQLAAARSSCGHPTLMQCLALDGLRHSSEVQTRMAVALLERGSPVNEPLVATASVGNLVVAQILMAEGAAIDGDPAVLGGWTPLEESLYWGSNDIAELLLGRGAAIPSLRAAAGLGRVDEMLSFFDETGSLRAGAGGINSPFGVLEDDRCQQGDQQIVDNALAYAAMSGCSGAAEFLLDRGANVGTFPVGFHFRGTALHWAAIRGHQAMCELLLERGADPASEDLTIRRTPAGWAAHEGHKELAEFLNPESPANQD